MERSRSAQTVRHDLIMLSGVTMAILLMPFWLPPIGGYAVLATKIAIWMIFAFGFDLLLGFTGFLSFGDAAFSMKTRSMRMLMANCRQNVPPRSGELPY